MSETRYHIPTGQTGTVVTRYMQRTSTYGPEWRTTVLRFASGETVHAIDREMAPEAPAYAVSETYERGPIAGGSAVSIHPRPGAQTVGEPMQA